MSFLHKVLEPPRYGFERAGVFYRPPLAELFNEFFFRLDILANRKRWISFFGWATTLVMAVPFYLFFTQYITWTLFGIGFFYSMVILGTHGTIWYHRYSTHSAFKFRNRFWRVLVQNLVVRMIPEETYVISHHVHHLISEKPGDPYNVFAGWWYCFLADAIHQPIRKDLSQADYQRVVSMLRHSCLRVNSYEEYLKWGSVCHPLYESLHFLLNWGLWFGLFYWMGGLPLVITIFASCGVWGIGIRTFNYEGHGGGKDKRKEGIDFDRSNLSINQIWPGLVTGEWHNNHHLYPNGARAGFQPYQWDYAWYFIYILYRLGGIVSYRDYRNEFYEKHYLPYLSQMTLNHNQANTFISSRKSI